MSVIPGPLPLPSTPSKITESKKSNRNPEFVSPEYLKKWSSDLPPVSDRISYTEILNLRKKHKIKHIVKLSRSSLKQNPELVFVILEDLKAFRSVLPSISNDSNFWESWDSLNIGDACVNAYSPPVKRPEIPNSYLGFLSKFVDFVYYFGIERPISRRRREDMKRPNSNLGFLSKIVDFVYDFGIDGPISRRRREDMKRPEIPNSNLGFLSRIFDFVYYFGIGEPISRKEGRRREDMKRAKEERLNSAREDKNRLLSKMKEERRIRMREVNREVRRRRFEACLQEARIGSLHMSHVWDELASNSAVTTTLGILFFYLFYRVVVLNYKKQKKDYDDRVKIEKAEAEERRAMRESEREWIGVDENDSDAKIATEFMKSGASVRHRRRRRKGSRPPQYIDRDVDVKFSDVAGLGKIRLELEEIVNFFTHGETYRKRGLKIPG